MNVHDMAYGNTDEATTSPDPLLQILSPNGYEKYEEGQLVEVTWRSNGLLDAQPLLLLNAGGDLVTSTTEGNWLADASPTVG